jgi:hypothetical protein
VRLAIKTALAELNLQNCICMRPGRRVQGQSEKDTPMGLSAILIAAALSLTMFIAVTDAS